MAYQWYVGVAHHQRETLAKRELENQGFEVYLPIYSVENPRKPMEPRILPFLAPYLFVRIDLVGDQRNARWQAVYSTRGIRSVISSGDRPQPVADLIVEEIRAREVDGKIKLKPREHCRFKKGDTVRLKGNPVDAIFDEPVDTRRAAIFISLLGRPNRLIVPLGKLSAGIAVTS